MATYKGKELIDPLEFDDPKDNIFVKDELERRKLTDPLEYDTPDKSPEEKIYIVFYFIDSDEDHEAEQKFAMLQGREEAYVDIVKMINQYSYLIDAEESFVMTETKQVNRKTNKMEYFMIHPNKSISIKKFCKITKPNIGQERLKELGVDSFDISDWYDMDDEEEEKPSEPVGMTVSTKKEEPQMMSDTSPGNWNSNLFTGDPNYEPPGLTNPLIFETNTRLEGNGEDENNV